MSGNVDIKTLFEAGAHFGHKTSRWHPGMEPYIHSAQSGVHIIDLNQTSQLLDEAMAFVEETVAGGRPILLVGTKRQTSGLIEQAGKDTGMPYVSVRWFGGMLTNFKTIQERIKRLKDLETRLESGELASRYNKLEVQRFQEEIATLEHNFGGIKELNGLPGAVFISDVVTEHNAVSEATKLAVPIVGVVDTNADPGPIDHPIPANDDAIKTLELIIGEVVAAIKRGQARPKPKAADEDPAEADPAKSEAKPAAVKKAPAKRPAAGKTAAETTAKKASR